MSRISNELESIVIRNLSDMTEDVLEWVRENFAPHDVFDKKRLEEWVEDNGYTKDK